MKQETRNSLPAALVLAQRWMESESMLRRMLGLNAEQPIRVLRIRRNFKFRKLIVETGNERFVCYSHHWPRGLRNLAEFTRQAATANVAVPQPVQQSTRWSSLLSQRCFSLVLPYVPGTALDDAASPELLGKLGTALGRLHGIRGSHWGPLMTNFRSRGTYWAGLLHYWKSTEQQFLKYGDFADKRDIPVVMQWLREKGRFLEGITTFSLIHGDPSSGNFLIQPDGGICLIDCDRIAFEPAPIEIANALLQGYCADDTARRMTLVNAYLAYCPDDVRQLWLEQAQFFIAAALLWRGQRKLQWSIKRRTSGHSSERAILAWRQLLLVIEAKPADWQSAVALLEH